MYAFNWLHYGTWRTGLINDIADRSTLNAKGHRYTLVHKFDVGRNVGTDYLRFNTTYRAPQVPLELTVEGGAQSVQIPVSGRPQNAELWIGLHFCQPGDRLLASLNGHSLSATAVDAHQQQRPLGATLRIPANQGVIGMPPTEQLDQRFTGLRWTLPVAELRSGRNTLSLQLEQRGTGSDRSLLISRIEVVTQPAPAG